MTDELDKLARGVLARAYENQNRHPEKVRAAKAGDLNDGDDFDIARLALEAGMKLQRERDAEIAL